MSDATTMLVAGSISGIIEGVSIQPLELIKTRFQINEGPPMRFWPTVNEILREGGVRQLYRGGLPEIAGLIPRAAAALSTLTFSQEVFRSWNDGHLPTFYAYLSGSLSGIPEAMAFSPFQVIKVRLMAKEHLGRYANTLDCARKVVASEGIGALAIGLAPTLWRNCVWNGLYYGTVLEIDRALVPLENRTADMLRTLAIGTGVGILCTSFNAPFDVVKSRFQSQLPGRERYTGVFSALATIYRDEGPRALYKGFLPKSLRLGLGQSIGLFAFKEIMKVAKTTDGAS